MNTGEFVAAVAEKSGLTKADAKIAVDAVLDTITTQLKAGGEVKLTGFGTFTVTDVAAKDGRNPRTGETIQMAAHKRPKFSAGKRLKDHVNAA